MGTAHEARSKEARDISYEEALAILGFDSKDHPSVPEITRAYRQKAVENHPDRGGSHEKMVDINLARKVLEAGPRPTYERPGDVVPTPTYRQPPAKKEEVTFNEAKSKAGIPSNVEWVFMTTMQRSSDSYMGDESSRSELAWVLYGRTADNHVFVGVEHASYSGLAGANDAGYDKWSMHSYDYGLSAKVTPSWLFGNIARALSGMQWYRGRFNSKVVEVKGQDPLQNEQAIWKAGRSGATSIKNILVNLGEVGADDPSVANRKIPVELKVEQDWRFGEAEPKPGFYREPPDRSNTWDGKYHGSYYRMTLNIAGRDYVLDEADTQKLLGLKVGGQSFLRALLGQYGDRGGKKLITRMPKGKMYLKAFAERLKGLPPPAVELLERAAEQMK